MRRFTRSATALWSALPMGEFWKEAPPLERSPSVVLMSAPTLVSDALPVTRLDSHFTLTREFA